MGIYSTLLSFIYPAYCFLCDNKIDKAGLCTECFLKLEPTGRCCFKCGVELSSHESYGDTCLLCYYHPCSFDSLSYPFIYNQTIFQLIKDFKYYDNTALVNLLAKFLEVKLHKVLSAHNIDIMLPVPMHFFKLLRRNFNHTSLLSAHLAKTFKVNHNPFVLKKHKITKEQMKLKASARSVNLKKAFSIANKYRPLIAGKNILLIDDIVTTGNTASECAKLLKNMGAKEVHVLVLARVRGIIKR